MGTLAVVPLKIDETFSSITYPMLLSPEKPHIRHSPRLWATIGLFQTGIIITSLCLPNNIINGATWYAQILDFGRIGLLFGIPIIDFILITRLVKICKRRKTYLEQFIDDQNKFHYDSIVPLYFVNLTSRQIESIEFAFKHSQEDSIIDTNLPFKLLQKYIH